MLISIFSYKIKYFLGLSLNCNINVRKFKHVLAFIIINYFSSNHEKLEIYFYYFRF